MTESNEIQFNNHHRGLGKYETEKWELKPIVIGFRKHLKFQKCFLLEIVSEIPTKNVKCVIALHPFHPISGLAVIGKLNWIYPIICKRELPVANKFSSDFLSTFGAVLARVSSCAKRWKLVVTRDTRATVARHMRHTSHTTRRRRTKVSDFLLIFPVEWIIAWILVWVLCQWWVKVAWRSGKLKSNREHVDFTVKISI